MLHGMVPKKLIATGLASDRNTSNVLVAHIEMLQMRRNVTNSLPGFRVSCFCVRALLRNPFNMKTVCTVACNK